MLRSHRLPATVCPFLPFRARLALVAGLLLAGMAVSFAGVPALASDDAPGGPPASMAATVEVEPGAVLTVAAALDAPPEAAARIWPVEIVDASGATVERVQLPLSGDAPRAEENVDTLPPGQYTVRPLASESLASACGGDTLFAVRASAAGDSSVLFTVEPCPPPR